MKTFDFWNYKWECAMEGGRIIHPDYPYVFYDERRVKKKDGVVSLTLGLAMLDHPIHYWNGKDYEPQYGGGLIRSIDTFTYGTFSALIQMPQGGGLWPAFWICGDGCWPQHGEIDISEGYSDNKYFRLFTPYFPWINPSWKTTTNMHYFDSVDKELGSRSVSIFKQPHNPATSFRKYECKWTPDEIVISIDGKVVRKDTDAVKMFWGNRARVIFDALCVNRDDIHMKTPMLIKEFKYESL